MLAEDRGERKGDVTEKHESGLSAVIVAVLDVGKEGVDRVKGLSPAYISSLRGREEVVLRDVVREGVQEAHLEHNGYSVDEADTPVVPGWRRSRGLTLPSL